MYEQVAYLMDEFKIPYTNPYCPEDWKDWYHYILYDPVTQIRFLYNLSFTGRPEVGYVTDTCFLTLPKGYFQNQLSDNSVMETYGFARNVSWNYNDLQVNPMLYWIEDIKFSIQENITSISVNNKHTGLSFDLSGHHIETSIYIL